MGGDERMSAALLDRLTHRATILEFVGTSYRFRQQLQHQESREQGDEKLVTPTGGVHFSSNKWHRFQLKTVVVYQPAGILFE